MVGVASLLVSDIVGSTARWAADELAMRADLEAHDEVVAQVIAGAGGRVFKHTGDGAMAAFVDPMAAVEAAVELQSALATVGWDGSDRLQVRVAVHSGGVHERHGDLFGSAVNRAARLAGVCPPGAVVVSGVTADLVADRNGPSLVQVGEVMLRGFERAERVFAVADDRVSPVERLESGVAEARSGNLPLADGELLGRAHELGQIWDALEDQRLVTLVGVGGMGKTRLALEVAAGIESRYADGVWWCDLSALTTEDAVAPGVLAALGGRRSAGRTVLESLVDHLASAEALVVLDNCEHVLPAVVEVVTAVRPCAAVTLLATSRESLGLVGERAVPIGSLDPDAAVALFEERARSARPDLVMEHRDVAAVRVICEQLDGIPLGIELAAARCRSMNPTEIAERLADRFRLLRGPRTSAERHRTLRAAVDWSYAMLEDDERDLFDAMAVFAGGTMLDGLAAVTGLDEYDALDLVDRLIARSLVVPSSIPLGTRYRQLETLRQYGEDRLIECGRIDELRDRHLEWVAELSRSFAVASGTPAAGAALHRYAVEIDNLRDAIAHALSTGRHDDAYRIIADSSDGIVGRPSLEILEWVDPIAAPGPWTEVRSDAAALSGLLGVVAGDTDAMQRVVAAIPPEHRPRWPVTRWRATERLLSGDAATIQRLLDDAGPLDAASEHERLTRQTLALFVPIIRAFEDGALDQETLTSVRVEADELVQRVRVNRDPLGLAFALVTKAILLANDGSPHEGLPIALEADAIAREHGLGVVVDAASNAVSVALGRLAQPDTDTHGAAEELHRRLSDAKQRRNHVFGVAMFGGVALLLLPRDPATAHTLDMVRTRVQPGYDGFLPDPATVLDADTVSRIRSRADRIDLADAIDLALAALDRLIADDEHMNEDR